MLTGWSLVLAAMAFLGVMALIMGAILGYAEWRFKVEGNPVVDQVDALLPQTQCGQCGFPGCRPYAEAITGGEAINKCPPGGESTIQALADLLGLEPLPLNSAHGTANPVPLVAYIREDECIGCTKCIQACPVDAIVGAAKQMHTVLVDECTGCDLCVEPCPVDCIDMVPISQGVATWYWQKPDRSDHLQSASATHAKIIATDRV